MSKPSSQGEAGWEVWARQSWDPHFTGRPASKGSVTHLSLTVHGGLRSHLPEMQTVKPTKSLSAMQLSHAPAVVNSVGNKNTPP